MNINEPNNSRQLAALISGVPFERRQAFIEAAEKASSMEAFIKAFMKSNAKRE